MTTDLDISVARVEEKIEGVKHDCSNMRVMLNTAVAVQETHYAELKSDIKELSKTLLGIGLSIAGGFVTVMIAILAYFAAQKIDAIKDNGSRITHLESKTP